jgi:hypothetical protein
MLEIDQEIVDNVYAIFNEHYGKVVVAETSDTETTTENKEIEIVDTIPDV